MLLGFIKDSFNNKPIVINYNLEDSTNNLDVEAFMNPVNHFMTKFKAI